MTASATDAPAQQLVTIELALIDPDPDNRKATIDREFVASVREHGVLEPILVVPHPDNDSRYMIVAGERRWRAASRAKLTTIPAVVRTDMDERARVEAQVSENLHRSDMAPCQEAGQLVRLIGLGHTVKTLAAAVGRSQGHVRTRLKLIELPKGAHKLIDEGSWTIDEGLEALKLLEHPDQLAEIIERPPHHIGHAVQRALTQIGYDAAMSELLAEIERKGLVVVDDVPRAGGRLDALGVDTKEHAAEECHAHVITGDRDWSKEPKLVPICTKANRHRIEGASDVKAANRPGKTAAEREEAARRREAVSARRESMGAAVKGKIAKGDCYDLILAAFLEGVRHEDAKRVRELLDITPGKGSIDDPSGDLMKFAAKSEPNRLKVAVAAAMVHHEDRYQQGWGTADQANRWMSWLTARGYDPTEWDRDHLADKKR